VKKQPQRTCVACRRTLSKRELRRIVRTVTGEVVLDPSGKLNGRGVYLCAYRECWDKALASKVLGTALKTTISADDMARLRAYGQQLPERPPTDADGEAALPSAG
jgi:hypothetical protein